MSDEELVRLERDGGVATITLDRRAKHNAFTDEMDAQFFDAVAEVSSDRDVRVVIWRGAGPSFSSGRDTTVLGVRPDGVSDLDYIAAGHARTRLLLEVPVPVIVALHGWVIGGSFERALLCDLRVAADDTRMLLPEVRHGVIPDSAGVARLFQMAGHGLATDLALTGRILPPDEALQHGVVSRVVPREDLDTVVRAMADEIASRPLVAVRQALGTIRGLATPEVEATLRHELLAQSAVMADPGFRRGGRARSATD